MYSSSSLVNVFPCVCGKIFLEIVLSDLSKYIVFEFSVNLPAWNLWQLPLPAAITSVGLNYVDELA